jgi:hypothetical protein
MMVFQAAPSEIETSVALPDGESDALNSERRKGFHSEKVGEPLLRLI